MNVQVLIVADYEVPKTTLEYFEQQGFHPQVTRGPLKTRQILSHQEIEAIVWYFLEVETGLSTDLIQVFNQFPQLPVITVSVGFTPNKFQKKLQGFFGSIDIADNKKEFVKLIENACNQHHLGKRVKGEVTEKEPQETDFCNVVQDAVLRKSDKEKSLKKNPPVNLTAPWAALDAREKKLLADISISSSELNDKSGTSFWNRIRKLFHTA